MSIAVSAVVRPSSVVRLLRVLVCAGVMLSALSCPGRAWAVACVVAGAAGLPWRGGNPKPRRIDISPVGQIRLTVYQQTGAGAMAPALLAQAPAPLALLAGSTLWPALLCLRLGRAGEPVREVLVAPGCVGRAAFRPLALACRAVAARGSGMADGT
ncbi:hypothetical protein H3H36_23680 [Duganella sp. FT3S]|uniref:Uncharacterized protein n=1 Tax=Rugamonas fusca TaxID=2758568 RepID=A0A7W2ELX5_9BURK|nr:hypothetical protein [Rugamonas fusca]MBA5608355.1 hypothetical protein [Rugamonas fusca]